jgi:periplasmic protein TonB
VKTSSGRVIRLWVYGGSIVLHAALAVTTLALPNDKRAETAAIYLADIKKKKEPPPPPPIPTPPPPQEKPKPPPPKPQAQAKAAAEAPKAEALPPVAMSADGFADLGVSLGGGGGDGEGVAVGGPAGPAIAAAAGPAAAQRPKEVTKKAVQELAPTVADTCKEPPVRPKRKIPVAPKYTMQARQAEIEGVVRVEVTVDESGHVISARVVSGLGYGLDEAALAAAKASVFEPASRCGRPMIGTVVLPFRFEST